MINQNTQYRMGNNALVYFIFRKLKYPFILICLMIGLTVLFSHMTLPVNIVSSVEKYGWFFSVCFAIFFGLTAIPEYRSVSVSLGEKALLVRIGLLSVAETYVPYNKIETIEIVQDSSMKIFGLASFFVRTSAEADIAQAGPTLEIVDVKFAEELRSYLLSDQVSKV